MIEREFARMLKHGYKIVVFPYKPGPWERPFYLLEWFLR